MISAIEIFSSLSSNKHMIYQPKQFNFQYKATFKSKKASNLRIWVVRPQGSNLQTITKFTLSPKPTKIYLDKQSNRIKYLESKDSKVDLEMRVELIANKEKNNIEKLSAPAINSSLKRYIISETSLEHTPEVIKLTKQITRNKATATDKLRIILKFIAENFTYQYPVKNRGVKNMNLHKLQGDCGEYSSLFVTMCRILKIPAINQTGFIFYPNKIITEHGWAKIYLKPLGWVDVDPQYIALEKSFEAGYKKYFCQRNDYRLTITNGFNIPLKPSIPRNYPIGLANKIGLPTTYYSTQTLQPISFASAKKVKFKDETKLI